MKSKYEKYTFSIAELSILFQMIIERLDADNVKNIEISNDKYWFVSIDEALNLSQTPDLLVGSLKEDLHYLREALAEGEIYSYSNLDRVAVFLKLISEKCSPSSDV